MFSELSPKALAAGVLSYVGAFLLLSVLMSSLANFFPDFAWSNGYWTLLSLLGKVMLGIGGFVSGWVAGGKSALRGLLHGLVVSIFGAILIASITAVMLGEGASFGLAYFIFGVPANCFGGLIGAKSRADKGP